MTENAIARVCVFCGSNPGTHQEYLDGARRLGRVLASRGIEVIYGGGRVGLMGAMADAVIQAGGKVEGVIPDVLVAKEIAHPRLFRLHVVSSMHERKAMMSSLSDAFIALPGGFGTLDEFCEIVTWGQLGLHRKPCGILNLRNYYDALLAFLNHGASEGFIRQEHRSMVLVNDDPDRLLDMMLAYTPPSVQKWITTPKET